MKCVQKYCDHEATDGFKNCLECRTRHRSNTRRWRNKHGSRVRRSIHLKFKYGITVEEWENIFDAQGRCCANPLCRATTPGHKQGWKTDHDHKTGKFRAILCHGCNIALGGVNDSVAKLRGLIQYLQPAVIEKTGEN